MRMSISLYQPQLTFNKSGCEDELLTRGGCIAKGLFELNGFLAVLKGSLTVDDKLEWLLLVSANGSLLWKTILEKSSANWFHGSSLDKSVFLVSFLTSVVVMVGGAERVRGEFLGLSVSGLPIKPLLRSCRAEGDNALPASEPLGLGLTADVSIQVLF